MPDEEAALRDLVQRHEVYWQVWPEYVVIGTKRLQVGFRVGLLGTHDHPRGHPIAGCTECWTVYQDLRSLAQWAVPKEDRESDSRIGVFDAALLYSPGRERKDVLLTITISHRRGAEQPVDACELRCLEEIEQRLRRVGARKGSWTDETESRPR